MLVCSCHEEKPLIPIFYVCEKKPKPLDCYSDICEMKFTLFIRATCIEATNSWNNKCGKEKIWVSSSFMFGSSVSPNNPRSKASTPTISVTSFCKNCVRTVKS